jgi:hypothetical protein
MNLRSSVPLFGSAITAILAFSLLLNLLEGVLANDVRDGGNPNVRVLRAKLLYPHKQKTHFDDPEACKAPHIDA